MKIDRVHETSPVASIVIPAHNEEAVLGRCLDRLAEGGGDAFEVVVVANACTDATAAVARARGARVVETATANKAHALNLGDRACSAFPRLYLDADVELTGAAAHRIVAALADAEVAAPRLRWSAEHVGWPVRAYYRVWSAMPYTCDGVVGSGLLAVSERGRARFAEFPDLIADDGFVSALFGGAQRRAVPDGSFLVHPPRDLASLVAVKTRVWVGNEQLRAYLRRHPEIAAPARPSRAAAVRQRLLPLLGRPRLWADLPVYAGVYAASRLLGLRRLRRGELEWLRDDSSRIAATGPRGSGQ